MLVVIEFIKCNNGERQCANRDVVLVVLAGPGHALGSETMVEQQCANRDVPSRTPPTMGLERGEG
jgi:hypothetical protein